MNSCVTAEEILEQYRDALKDKKRKEKDKTFSFLFDQTGPFSG
jgi:hypothetical protein